MTAWQIVDLEKLAESQEAAVRVSADPDAKPVRLTEQRITTTLRIEPALLRELKYAALEDDRKVNDLILEGIHHVLSLREGQMAQARDPSRFQSPSARPPPNGEQRTGRNLAALADLPSRIGPAEFSILGAMAAVRCPQDLDPLMRKAGGMWEPGSRRWLIERRRINPLVRNLRRATDPLFRQAGMDLDQTPDGGPMLG